MANSFGIGYSAKLDALAAILDGKTLKMALFTAAASRGPSDATYTTTGELAATGNYTAGGNSVSNGTNSALDGATAHWTSNASVVFTNLTSSAAFDCGMLYNTATSRNLGTFNLGTQNITAATFTLTMPTNNGTTGLMRLG